MSKALSFRKFQKEDLVKISEFRKTLFEPHDAGRSCEPEYYEWKCYGNPIQPGETWLAEVDNKVVAMRNATSKMMKILGTVVKAAEMGDSFTHPDYQRQGLFTQVSKAARESILNQGVKLIYNLPSKEATLPGHIKKLNHLPVPIGLRNLVKPILPKQILKKMLSPPFLAAIISPIVEIASQAIFKISLRGIGKSDIFVSPELNFPDDIDTLWERSSKNYDIMLVRTKDYLEWRYVSNPDIYSILIARNKDGAILGYMVTKMGFYGDVTAGFIADFLTIEDDPNIFKKLLSTSLEKFYQQEVNIVSTLAIKGSFYDKLLLRTGFFPRSQVPFLCYKNELGSQVLSGNYKWHFTMGDSDHI